MNRKISVPIKIIGVLFGVLGIIFLIMGISMFKASFSEPVLIVGLVFLLILGSYLVFVSYLLLRKFSPQAVKQFCGVLAFALMGVGNPLHKFASKFVRNEYAFFVSLIWLCILVWFYQAFSEFLSKRLFTESALEKHESSAGEV